jgi:hypothetical protein
VGEEEGGGEEGEGGEIVSDLTLLGAAYVFVRCLEMAFKPRSAFDSDGGRVFVILASILVMILSVIVGGASLLSVAKP